MFSVAAVVAVVAVAGCCCCSCDCEFVVGCRDGVGCGCCWLRLLLVVGCADELWCCAAVHEFLFEPTSRSGGRSTAASDFEKTRGKTKTNMTLDLSCVCRIMLTDMSTAAVASGLFSAI